MIAVCAGHIWRSSINALSDSFTSVFGTP